MFLFGILLMETFYLKYERQRRYQPQKTAEEVGSQSGSLPSSGRASEWTQPFSPGA